MDLSWLCFWKGQERPAVVEPGRVEPKPKFVPRVHATGRILRICIESDTIQVSLGQRSSFFDVKFAITRMEDLPSLKVGAPIYASGEWHTLRSYAFDGRVMLPVGVSFEADTWHPLVGEIVRHGVSFDIEDE